MDTVTQMTLGAAVGELTLGRKVGNKAVFWGALAGAIPDMDIVAGPFVDSVAKMTFHRGFTHSFTFVLLIVPLLGYLIHKIYRGKEASLLNWINLVFWATLTHPLLDNFTTYGTQLFWPFSDYRIAWNTISTIDPLYSVPLFISIIIILFLNRTSKRRRLFNYIGLTLSSFYLIFTCINKIHINTTFKNQLTKQGIRYNRILTIPTLFNNILWRGVAEGSGGYWEGYYSLFDGYEKIQFDYVPKNHILLEGINDQQELQKLIRLTKGYFVIIKEDGHLSFNDMRYGRFNGWARLESDYIFSYKLIKNASDEKQNLLILRKRPKQEFSGSLLSMYAKRVFGKLDII